jgi:cytochrome c-L
MPGAARIRSLLPFALAVLCLGPAAWTGAAAQEVLAPERKPDGTIQFRLALDNSPIELDLRPDQTLTPAVVEFQQTGQNPYRGDAKAIAAGKAVWQKWCRACHLDDGTGRIGPNLVDDKVQHKRVATDVGQFEVIYAGGAGAMQAFGKRVDQDTILAVMAYLAELQAAAKK